MKYEKPTVVVLGAAFTAVRDLITKHELPPLDAMGLPITPVAYEATE